MFRVAASILLCVSAPALAESSYLCTSEKELGFSYSESSGEWESRAFQGNQFLFKPLEQADRTGNEEYGVYETKRGTLLFRCYSWFPKIGIAHCGNQVDYHFKFGRTSDTSARFVSSDLGVGYIYDSKSAVPRIGVGECIKL